MYLPILRGKQYELLALRQFAPEISGSSKISPIIEPVKLETKGLETTCKILTRNDVNFTLIINPVVGEIKNTSHLIKLISQNDYLKKYKNFQIGIYTSSGGELRAIMNQLETNGLSHKKLVIIYNDVIEDEEFIQSIQDDYNIRFNVINADKIKSRRFKRLFPPETQIMLEDAFTSKNKNADYTQQVDEFFSEEHLVFTQENYAGFSDYITIGEQYLDGGFLPFAVAIHLTYLASNKSIRIHHFVSDSNEDYADTPGKFAEALEKLIDFIPKLTIKTDAVKEFQSLHDSGHYPGLGSIKKLSILNHLELINTVLS